MPKNEKNEHPARRTTIRHFVDSLREERISPTMLDIQIGIAVEQLRDDHGIVIDPDRLARMVNAG